MLDQLEPVWPAHLRRFEDLFALHYVSSPPAFLNSPPVTTYLLQFIDDRFDQVHEDDILALVSIVMESPERKQRLKVLWAPDSIRVQVRSQRYTILGATLPTRSGTPEPDGFLCLQIRTQEVTIHLNWLGPLAHRPGAAVERGCILRLPLILTHSYQTHATIFALR